MVRDSQRFEIVDTKRAASRGKLNCHDIRYLFSENQNKCRMTDTYVTDYYLLKGVLNE